MTFQYAIGRGLTPQEERYVVAIDGDRSGTCIALSEFPKGDPTHTVGEVHQMHIENLYFRSGKKLSNHVHQEIAKEVRRNTSVHARARWGKEEPLPITTERLRPVAIDMFNSEPGRRIIMPFRHKSDDAEDGRTGIVLLEHIEPFYFKRFVDGFLQAYHNIS